MRCLRVTVLLQENFYMTKKFLVVFGFLLTIAAVAAAQQRSFEVVEISEPRFPDPQYGNGTAGHSEIGLQATGTFPRDAAGNGIQQHGTNAAGFLASYRYHFNSWHAIEVNYGYTRDSQNYSALGGTAAIQ